MKIQQDLTLQEEQVAIGIDLGGTAIKYAAVTPGGEILWEARRPTQADRSRERIIENVIEAAKEAHDEAMALGKTPVGIGIGTPGIVDIERGVVLGGADNLTDWVQVPLGERIAEALDLPTFVDNDANLMGLGEYAYGGNRDARHLLFLTIGTGIGGAIFLNGALYRGHRNAAGEVGAVMMNYEGREAYWEEFASTTAMVRRYRERSGGRVDEKVNGQHIFERYLRGEALAAEIVAEHARLVGFGLAGYIDIFNPERIVIGGGISEAGQPYIELIDAAARRYAMADCSEGVAIAAARLGNKAGFLGAAFFAFSRLSGK